MKRRKNPIELTSLLDVILILMFVVMVQNTKMFEKATSAHDDTYQSYAELQQEYEELKKKYDSLSDELKDALAKLDEGELDELLARLEKAENKADALSHVNEVVKVINISLTNSASGAVQYLEYGYADSEASVYEFSSADERNVVMDRLTVTLDKWVTESLQQDDAMVYIVFSYDKDEVYFTDRIKVQNIIDKIEDNDRSGRVRCKVSLADTETEG